MLDVFRLYSRKTLCFSLFNNSPLFSFVVNPHSTSPHTHTHTDTHHTHTHTHTHPAGIISIISAVSEQSEFWHSYTIYVTVDGFGGLVVSMLASGIRVRGFKPGRSHWIFRTSEKKILRMPSFGGEVKESVPCPSFAACKRT